MPLIYCRGAPGRSDESAERDHVGPGCGGAESDQEPDLPAGRGPRPRHTQEDCGRMRLSFCGAQSYLSMPVK